MPTIVTHRRNVFVMDDISFNFDRPRIRSTNSHCSKRFWQSRQRRWLVMLLITGGSCGLTSDLTADDLIESHRLRRTPVVTPLESSADSESSALETIDFDVFAKVAAEPVQILKKTPAVKRPVASHAPAIWNVHISNPQPAAEVDIPTPPPVKIYNVPPVEKVVVDPAIEQRNRIAERVSDQILLEQKPVGPMMAAAPISESLTSIQLIRRCDERTLEADRLLRTGAAYSAHRETVEALRCLSAAIDLQRRGRESTASLEAGLEAMREAGDFVGRYGHIDTDGIARMVVSHETAVLKNRDVSQLTPHAAADAYLDEARNRLSQAVGGQPQGARLLMLLANAERNRNSENPNLADAIAISCLRAAVTTNPQDPLLASELGYHAMRAGLLGEAQWSLERSLALQPNRPAVQNLIETYRIGGNIEAARQLVASLPENLTSNKRSMQVTMVSPDAFASISPPLQTQPYNAAPDERPRQVSQQPTSEYPLQPQPVEPSVLDRMTSAWNGVWR